MKRQEIPILRDNEIPSAQSYNALAAPIRNIKSLTPETLRITQNPSNGGLQFEVPPYARQAATGSSDEEKTPVVLNCSFAISVGEKNEDGSYPVTVAPGTVYVILLNQAQYCTKFTFDTTINENTWIYVKIQRTQSIAYIYTSNTQISNNDATAYYILLGFINYSSGELTQYHIGDIFLDLPLSFIPLNRNVAYIQDGTLYLSSDLGGDATCIIAIDGKKVKEFTWEAQYTAQGNYGVYYQVKCELGIWGKIVYIPQDSAVDSDTEIYIPLVLLHPSGTSVTFVCQQYINIGGRWV